MTMSRLIRIFKRESPSFPSVFPLSFRFTNLLFRALPMFSFSLLPSYLSLWSVPFPTSLCTFCSPLLEFHIRLLLFFPTSTHNATLKKTMSNVSIPSSLLNQRQRMTQTLISFQWPPWKDDDVDHPDPDASRRDISHDTVSYKFPPFEALEANHDPFSS